MSDIVILIPRAYALAAVMHADQTRPHSGEPYLNHLAEVAHLLAFATDGIDPELVIAGVLHDVLEKSDVSQEQLQELFGPAVGAVVAEVSDPENVDEQTRRRLQVEHAGKLSKRAKQLKIADKTSNLRERCAAVNASADENRDYLQWAIDVVAGCRGENERLESAFDAAVEECEKKFGIQR